MKKYNLKFLFWGLIFTIFFNFSFLNFNSDKVHASENEILKGISLLDKTFVFSQKDLESTILKGYKKGSILQFTDHNIDDNWYEAIVFIEGVKKEGFIHKESIEKIDLNPSSLSGYAIKDTVNVYNKPTNNGEVLKRYSFGKLLYFKTLSDNWYEALAYVNGIATIGYINAEDVEQPTKNPKLLSGIATKNNTNVYTNPSKHSSKIKSYDIGSVLYYETFITGWYKALVYINSKPNIGYISADDVENPTNNPVSKSGIALRNKTKVYSEPTKSSPILKSYDQGKVLYYKTFISNWYEAIVYINGKATKGYIYKTDVEEPIEKQQLLKGISINKTPIYISPTKNSKTIKSYKEGSTLYFKTYLNDWYEALVYVNGEAKIGYIYKNDVRLSSEKESHLKGVALKNKTYVYENISKSSKKIKSYNRSDILQFKAYTKNWYEALVYLDGKPTTGYLNKDDIDLIDTHDTIIRNVPVLDQFPSWPTGCESVAVTMLLNWSGNDVSVSDVVKVLPRGPRPYWFGGMLYGANPEKEFVGHPSQSGSFGVYDKPLIEVINHFTNNQAVNLSNKSFEEQLEVVKKGTPIVMWNTIKLLPSYKSVTWYDEDKNKITWTANEHAFVVVGVTQNYIIVHDPYIGKRVLYDKDLVKKRWKEMGGRAVTLD